MSLIYDTASITYMGSKKFKNYQNSLLDEPEIAVVTEHPDIQTKCEDPSKAIFTLFCTIRQGQFELDQTQVQEILDRIICEIIGRFYPNETQISDYFDIENKEVLD